MGITWNAVIEFLFNMLQAVVENLSHNWIALTLAIVIAVLMQVYVDTDKLKKMLLARPKVSIAASVAFGAFTPLCACGTMAVVIGMLSTTVPWGAIMAFLTSSPLMSPDGFIMLTGVISLQFALALTIASIIIGLSSGYITHLIETKTGFLKNQTRFAAKTPSAAACGCQSPESSLEKGKRGLKKTRKPVLQPQLCGCSEPQPNVCGSVQVCCEGASAAGAIRIRRFNTGINLRRVKSKPESNFAVFIKKIKGQDLLKAFLNTGLKQILLYFSIFVAVGFVINSFIPSSVIVALFSPDSIFAVPLAAFIGLPLYVSGDAAIPLIKALMAGGAGGGAMLAFMITGPATSAWVIAGITAFLKKRAIGLYIAYILVGGILLGYLYDLVVTILA